MGALEALRKQFQEEELALQAKKKQVLRRATKPGEIPSEDLLLVAAPTHTGVSGDTGSPTAKLGGTLQTAGSQH